MSYLFPRYRWALVVVLMALAAVLSPVRLVPAEQRPKR